MGEAKKSGTKNIKAPQGKRSWLVLFLLLLAVIVFIILARTQSGVTEDIVIEFSPYPGAAIGAAAVSLYYDSPEIDYIKLEEILHRASQQGIPVTLFFTSREAGVEVNALLTEKPRHDFNASLILAIIDRTGVMAEIGTAGYADIPYPTLTYFQQEALIRQSKLAWKESGVTVTSFLPPSLQATYDTILAAENNKLKTVIIPGENSSSPLHPRAVVGGLMNVLLLPYSETLTEGINIIFISGGGDDYSGIEKAFFDLRSDGSLWKGTVSEIDARVRDAEAIGATLVTDPKAESSILTISGAKDGSKAVFRTRLNAHNITVGNTTRTAHPMDGGFTIFLNATDRQATIEWDIED